MRAKNEHVNFSSYSRIVVVSQSNRNCDIGFSRIASGRVYVSTSQHVSQNDAARVSPGQSAGRGVRWPPRRWPRRWPWCPLRLLLSWGPARDSASLGECLVFFVHPPQGGDRQGNLRRVSRSDSCSSSPPIIVIIISADSTYRNIDISFSISIYRIVSSKEISTFSIFLIELNL